MPSIEEIIREVVTIKNSSEELAQLIGSASRQLGQDAQKIAALVQGSATGMQAVSAVSMATHSLADAATSLKTLCRTCDDCAQNLAK